MRLGKPVSSGPAITAQDVATARMLIAGAGGHAPANDIPLADFAWIPSTAVTASSCTAALGQTISAGGPLATVGPLPRISITAVPADIVPGDRQLQLDAVPARQSAQLALSTASDVSRILATPTYQVVTALDPEGPSRSRRPYR